MKTKAPDWAIAKIDGIPAERYVAMLDIKLAEANRAYCVMHQTYQMTHNVGFREIAQIQATVMRGIRTKIAQNFNLYCIIKKGYSLN